MPITETPNTVNVSSGESNNDAPVALGSFQRIWNRLSSVLSRRQRDTGEDEVERGEHQQQSKDILHVREGSHEEHAEAGAIPVNEPPAAATESQHHSQFSSTAFDRLPQPVPVVDIFFGPWWPTLALRIATRPVVVYYSYFWLWSLISFSSGFGVSWNPIGFEVILVIYILRWAVLVIGIDTIPILGIPIPGKRQLLWALFRWVQTFWVSPACTSESYGPLITSNRSIS